VVLKYELVLLEQMRFQLAVHHPFHAVEGLCIKAKVREEYAQVHCLGNALNSPFFFALVPTII
jgi:hypothetical protein